MSGLKMKYFVLNPKSKHIEDQYAFASRAAMVVYAEQIRDENEDLANDLLEWVEKEDYADSDFRKARDNDRDMGQSGEDLSTGKSDRGNMESERPSS